MPLSQSVARTEMHGTAFNPVFSVFGLRPRSVTYVQIIRIRIPGTLGYNSAYQAQQSDDDNLYTYDIKSYACITSLIHEVEYSVLIK